MALLKKSMGFYFHFVVWRKSVLSDPVRLKYCGISLIEVKFPYIVTDILTVLNKGKSQTWIYLKRVHYDPFRKSQSDHI